jgi:hypothetical protein
VDERRNKLPAFKWNFVHLVLSFALHSSVAEVGDHVILNCSNVSLQPLRTVRYCSTPITPLKWPGRHAEVFLNGACSVTLPYFVPTSFLLFPDYWVFMLSLLPRSLVLMRLDPFSGIRPRLASAMRTTEWDPESISGLPPPWARVQV